jgi:hypothetical protein
VSIDSTPRPRTRTLRIVAQDPSVRDRAGRMLTASVEVPAEDLEPGPRGYRVQVIDFDASTSTLYKPMARKASVDPFRDTPDKELLANPDFHAQNVYAIVMRTLARFEFALGRRVKWSFPGHQLQVAPHAFAGANAFYSREAQALVFGYFPGRKGTVFTCLSHDVVAHETTHALVDGLRERYSDPSSPDQAAFHESFADVAALLSVFALPEVVELLLDRVGATRGGRPLLAVELTSAENLRRSALLGLAEQMGREMDAVRGGPLRQSATLPPSPKYLSRDAYQEPHRRGEIFVAAMLNSFVAVWRHRLAGLGEIRPGFYDRSRVAEEGASAANHLLTMSIRALDYAPPTDLEFGDFLSALLTADTEIQPDDSRFQYRQALLNTFRAYGIAPSSKQQGGVWEPPGGPLRYAMTHFEPMQRDPDEVFRFLWENRKPLGLCEDAYSRVLSVRPCLRIGPDGFPLRETVAEYFQTINLKASELGIYGIARPEAMPASTAVKLYGGGALIFDEYGRLKFHVRNRIGSGERQTRRLKYLWEYGFFDKGAAALQRFSRMHLLKMMGRPMEKVEA